jgi:DNA ligase 1
MSATFDDLAACARRIAETNSRNEKVAHAAAWLAALDDADLQRAVLYLSGRAFPASSARKLTAGHATMRAALAEATGWDVETIRECYREVGDTGEAFSLLLRGHTAGAPLPLARAAGLFDALAAARATAAKVELLRVCFTAYSPEAVRYFLKAITGNLRIGLQEKMVEEAAARAAGVDPAAVRAAHMRCGDLGRVALAARRGEHEDIPAELFHPLDFMLARPLDDIAALEDPENWLMEDKYDGIRAQLHIAHGRVRVFTRGLEEATAAFPELSLAFRDLQGPLVLDGEVLAWREGRALPFQILQTRLARKRVSAAQMAAAPVVFLAYDILLHEGQLVLDEPLEHRRALLEQLALPQISTQREAVSALSIEEAFAGARGRGNEGLVLKRKGNLSEAGRRGGAWLKVKRPFATLDVAVTAAEQGRGRRAAVWSDLTFAVCDGERFVNIGKAYSGLTDAEIREMTRLLKPHVTQRFGRVHLLEPTVVLEVAFDGLQKSSRHKSGFALRFPRIVRWRKDKQPHEADTLDRVRELYAKALDV